MESLELHNVLFVYGELMRGRERDNFLSKEKTKFLGPAIAKGALYFFGDFPGLVLDSSPSHDQTTAAAASAPTATPQLGNAHEVHGELFEIFDPVTFFDTFDVIEGYWPDQAERSLFVRKLISVKIETGATMAWAYVLNLPTNGLTQLS